MKVPLTSYVLDADGSLTLRFGSGLSVYLAPHERRDAREYLTPDEWRRLEPLLLADEEEGAS
jgi:hypothetical protein